MTARRGAFAYPNFRRYWLSSLVKVFGLQFRFIGAGWLVHQLTDSPFWLGVPGLISALATILLTVPGGALADRMDNQRLLVVAQALTGILHGILALLIVTDLVRVWMVLVWAAVAGVLAAITNPTQNAILPRLIHRDAMASAVAFTAAIWNSTRIVGPAVAGIVIAVVGIGQAFFVTAVGYAISTLLIWSLRLEPQDYEQSEETRGMLAGVRYILTQRVFLSIIGLSFFSSIFGRSYVVLLPIFADDVLGVGVQGFGYLEAAAGTGALLGTLSIVRIRTGRHTGTIMIGAAVAFGLWVAAFSVSRSLELSMVMLFAAAFFSSIYLNLGMTTLQLMVPDALRGRVMGVWGLTWFLSSAGGFFSASLAEFVGPSVAVAVGALSVSAFAVCVWLAFAELRALPGRDGVVAQRT